MVGAALRVVTFREEAFLNGLAEAIGFALFELLLFVETADEQEVGDLLDHFERVGDATGPESIPNLIDLITDFAGKH